MGKPIRIFCLFFISSIVTQTFLAIHTEFNLVYIIVAMGISLLLAIGLIFIWDYICKKMQNSNSRAWEIFKNVINRVSFLLGVILILMIIRVILQETSNMSYFHKIILLTVIVVAWAMR